MTTRTRILVALTVLLGLLTPFTGVGPAQAAPQGEIIGGQQASPGEYPFMVAVLKRNTADRFQAQFCGASLIALDEVLTAAHCVRGRSASSLDVLIGTNRLAGTGGERIHVSAIHIHPGYNPNTSGNDIAVLDLAEASSFGQVTPLVPAQASRAAAGTISTVIGWGDRDRRPNATNFPVNLYEVTIPIRTNGQCSNAYGAGYIASKMLCAGDLVHGGRDSCQGDSGGPLLVPDGGGGWFQAGVVSFGVGCGRADFPGVYTRVTTYKNFLQPYLPI